MLKVAAAQFSSEPGALMGKDLILNSLRLLVESVSLGL